MKYSREKLVQLVQCAGLDLIKHANELVDNIDGRTRFKIDIWLMDNGMINDVPTINVHQEHLSKTSVPVATDTMDFTEVFDNYILDRVEKGETYITLTSSEELNQIKSWAGDF